MLNNYVNFDFSIMKKLWDVGHEKLINIIGRHGILDIFKDGSHTLEMTICVVNQLKNVRDCRIHLLLFVSVVIEGILA